MLSCFKILQKTLDKNTYSLMLTFTKKNLNFLILRYFQSKLYCYGFGGVASAWSRSHLRVTFFSFETEYAKISFRTNIKGVSLGCKLNPVFIGDRAFSQASFDSGPLTSQTNLELEKLYNRSLQNMKIH